MAKRLVVLKAKWRLFKIERHIRRKVREAYRKGKGAEQLMLEIMMWRFTIEKLLDTIESGCVCDG